MIDISQDQENFICHHIIRYINEYIPKKLIKLTRCSFSWLLYTERMTLLKHLQIWLDTNLKIILFGSAK